MDKRIFLALLVVTLAAGGVFAEVQLSAGLGGSFTADFQNYRYTSDGKDMLDARGLDKDINNMNRIGGGFFAYFDASYVMASLGMTFYNFTPANKDEKKDWKDDNYKISDTEFNIGVYGKYPIEMGKMVLFPILGADIKLALGRTYNADGEKSKYTDDEGEEVSPLKHLTTVYFRGGVGLDIPLGEKMYLRPIFLYGIGTKSNDQKEDEDGAWNKDPKLMSYINHGLDIKLALGFKF